MLLRYIFYILLLTQLVLSIPPNDKALFDNDGPESRIHKRRRPCRGRTPDGRTFFDWSYQHIDVNHNYNYNINCGGNGGHGGGGGGGPQKPIFQGDGGNGGGGPQKPILNNILQGVGNGITGGDHPEDGLFGSNGPINFVSTQVQNILSNPPDLGSFLPQDTGSGGGGGLGSWFQGGLFNGQGILSLFENGLFSGIFDNRPSSPQNRPPVINNNRPPVNNNRPPVIPSRPPYRPPAPVTTPDPDDVIYNDERPVHEDHDPVVPDQYSRPGQYFVASNPVFGSFVFDVSGNNRNRIVRQFNREINSLTRLFGF